MMLVVMTGRRMQKHDAGFSLIELLVSLTLLAMILGLLPGAFKTGKRGWETAAAIEQRASTSASMDYLRHRLAEATRVFDKEENGRSHLAFTGTREALSFVAPAPAGPAGGGLYRFAVTTERDNAAGTTAMTLSMTPYRQTDARSAPVVSKHILMPAVTSFQLRYFGLQGDGEPAAWSNEWRFGDRLPAIVEVQAQSPATGTGAPIRVELKMTSGS